MLYFSESIQEAGYSRLDAAILHYSETVMLAFIVTPTSFTVSHLDSSSSHFIEHTLSGRVWKIAYIIRESVEKSIHYQGEYGKEHT